MRKMLIAAAFVALGFSVASASTYLNRLVLVPRPQSDTEVQDPGPCILPEETRSVAPLAHQGGVLLFYTCYNPFNRITMVRIRDYGVAELPPPSATLVPSGFVGPTVVQVPVSCAHIPGFINTKDGLGCVPPGHPLAR